MEHLPAKKIIELKHRLEECDKEIQALAAEYIEQFGYIMPQGPTAAIHHIITLHQELLRRLAEEERKTRGGKE